MPLPRRTSWLLLLVAAATSCRALEDKRVFQYLNRAGFGKRYQGNASEEVYASIGDAVAVTDAYNPEWLTTPPQAVDIDGTIDMPEIGSVHVAGLTEGEIEALLTARYTPYFERLRLKVRIRSTFKWFFVFGEVILEGRQPFLGDTTLMEAVLQARPNPLTANLARVRVIRGDPVDPLTFVVNLERILDAGDTTWNIRLQENDILVVPPTVLGAIGSALEQLAYPVTRILGTATGLLFGYFGIRAQRTFF